MASSDKKTRKIVVKTARKLMLQKGREGVRMQEIADKAGVNKGLLHYYFKSKTNLFEEIFTDELNNLFRNVVNILQGDSTLEMKLSMIVDSYFDLLNETPQLCNFIFAELQNRPDLLNLSDSENTLEKSVTLLDNELRNSGFFTSPTYALEVLLNIMSMCILPFSMKPMVERGAKSLDKTWNEFISERREFVKTVVVSSFR